MQLLPAMSKSSSTLYIASLNEKLHLSCFQKCFSRQEQSI